MSGYTRPGLPKSDPSLLRLQLVGPMQAFTLDNERVLPPGRKTRGLLAIIAMAGRRPVLRSKLAEMLWSRRSEEQARASLRQEIHRLLDALAPVGAPVISVERHALALKPGLTTVDAERLLNANVNHVIAQASALARTDGAPGLPSGTMLPPLDGVLLEELNGTDPALDLWLAGERRRMREHALALFEAALQRRPDPAALIAICRQLLLLNPLHEGAWRGLIRAQLVLGERGAALQSAAQCAELFSSRLSGEPSGETGRLLAELRSAEPAERDVVPAVEPKSDGGDNAEAAAQPAGPDEDVVVSMAGRRLHDRHVATLAVLPPLDLDTATDDRLVPALTEELTVALANHPVLAVISGTVLAQALVGGRDDELLRRNLGLDYVLDGTVQRGRGRIRIILRLLDLRLQGHVVWAQRFDSEPDDVLGRLDEVAAQVSAQLPWELLVIESRRVGGRPAAELNANQLVLRALARTMRTERSQNDSAGDLLHRAEALDPEHPLIPLAESLRRFVRVIQFWGEIDEEARLASSAIRKSLDAGRVDPVTMATAGFIRGLLQDEPEVGLGLIRRALDHHPTMSMGLVFASFVLARLGRLDEAKASFESYKRLSPLHPMHYMFDGIGLLIDLLRGDVERVARIGRELVELSPSFLYPAIPTLAAYGLLGQDAEAERLLARIEAMDVEVTVEEVLRRLPLSREQDRARLRDGLRRTGMAEQADGRLGRQADAC